MTPCEPLAVVMGSTAMAAVMLLAVAVMMMMLMIMRKATRERVVV